MFERWLSRENRERAREIACETWVDSSFDAPQATELAKAKIADDKAKGTYGNVLVAVMVAYYVMLLVQMAYKYWKSKQVQHPPAQSEPGEPFGLTGGAS
jgi:hypothetical protein